MLEEEKSLLIVGGSTKLFLSDHRSSPVSDQVELYSCKGTSVEIPPLPKKLFGANLGWDGESVLSVCGGSSWKQAYSQCYQLDLRTRSLARAWTQIASLNIKRAFGLLLYMEDETKNINLYQFGGLNPMTYEPILSVEVYDQKNDSWAMFKEIPKSFSFPESPDYGCMAIRGKEIYSVEQSRIVKLDWDTWQVAVVCFANN